MFRKKFVLGIEFLWRIFNRVKERGNVGLEFLYRFFFGVLFSGVLKEDYGFLGFRMVNLLIVCIMFLEKL